MNFEDTDVKNIVQNLKQFPQELIAYKTRCAAAKICSEKYLSGEWTTQTDARNCAEDIPYLLNLLAERDVEIEILEDEVDRWMSLQAKTEKALRGLTETLTAAKAILEPLPAAPDGKEDNNGN